MHWLCLLPTRSIGATTCSTASSAGSSKNRVPFALPSTRMIVRLRSPRRARFRTRRRGSRGRECIPTIAGVESHPHLGGAARLGARPWGARRQAGSRGMEYGSRRPGRSGRDAPRRDLQHGSTRRGKLRTGAERQRWPTGQGRYPARTCPGRRGRCRVRLVVLLGGQSICTGTVRRSLDMAAAHRGRHSGGSRRRGIGGRRAGAG